jgi:hypothetical protein
MIFFTQTNKRLTSVTTTPHLISMVRQAHHMVIVVQRFRSRNLIFMSSLQRYVVTLNVMRYCVPDDSIAVEQRNHLTIARLHL